MAENEKLKTRYTNLFELRKISMDSRESPNKLKEKVWGKQQEQEQEQGEQKK